MWEDKIGKPPQTTPDFLLPIKRLANGMMYFDWVSPILQGVLDVLKGGVPVIFFADLALQVEHGFKLNGIPHWTTMYDGDYCTMGVRAKDKLRAYSVIDSLGAR
jgi:hypothetical protein